MNGFREVQKISCKINQRYEQIKSNLQSPTLIYRVTSEIPLASVRSQNHDIFKLRIIADNQSPIHRVVSCQPAPKTSCFMFYGRRGCPLLGLFKKFSPGQPFRPTRLKFKHQPGGGTFCGAKLLATLTNTHSGERGRE